MLNTSTDFGSSPESIPPSQVTIETQSLDSIAHEDEQHPSISPATPAESFFLSQLSTNQISAAALASSMNRTHSQRSVRSTTTDEFLSAHGSISDSITDEFESPRETTNHQRKSLFGTDILVFASAAATTTIDEDEEHEDEEQSFSSPSDKMPESVAKGSYSNSTTKASAASASSAEEEPHFDAATHLYSTVKNVWSWSRSLPVAGPILGLYETAGTKIITTATKKDVDTMDKELLHCISGLDKDVIDPAVATILKVIFPAVEKVEDIVKVLGPKIPFMVYLFPMLTEEGEKNSPETSTPKVASLEVD